MQSKISQHLIILDIPKTKGVNFMPNFSNLINIGTWYPGSEAYFQYKVLQCTYSIMGMHFFTVEV